MRAASSTINMRGGAAGLGDILLTAIRHTVLNLLGRQAGALWQQRCGTPVRRSPMPCACLALHRPDDRALASTDILVSAYLDGW